MSRILCVAVAMSVLAGPAFAGMSEGVAAVTVGDYPKAITEFQPLAASGDPVAQYHLAKIYLEGHGPADGVPQGIDLMTKAATGGYPEAQAQLGLMYAMGLGVPADNAQAYDWLTKAINALPDGTRRTVAESNRAAVLKRMNEGQQTTAVAAKPAETVTKAADPAPVQKQKPAAQKPAAETTVAKTKATTPATTKTVTETAATGTTATAASKPAATTTTAKATETKAPEKATQVASAKAPEAPATAGKAPTGVRIQLISMPTEDAAWAAWKTLSGKYSAQLSGLSPVIETADLGTKGTFYRVQTGPFDTVAKAQERCGAMKEAGLDCLVVGKP